MRRQPAPRRRAFHDPMSPVVRKTEPPGTDARSARPYVLAHLLMILLLEPLIDALADSPRPAAA